MFKDLTHFCCKIYFKCLCSKKHLLIQNNDAMYISRRAISIMCSKFGKTLLSQTTSLILISNILCLSGTYSPVILQWAEVISEGVFSKYFVKFCTCSEREYVYFQSFKALYDGSYKTSQMFCFDYTALIKIFQRIPTSQ